MTPLQWRLHMTMEILVVEDNPFKRNRIVEVIKNAFPFCAVQESHSFTSAWKCISHEAFSLIVLDMSLPTFDKTDTESGGVFRVFGGKELARKMIKRGIDSKLIFITQYKNFSDNVNSCSFESLKTNLLIEYEQNCLGFILYSNNQSEWREELVTSIREHIE